MPGDIDRVTRLVNEHFDTLAPLYEPKAETRRAYLDGIDERIVAHLQAQGSGLAVLDVGCGPGQRSVRLQRRLAACRLFGCDLSEQVLRVARTVGLHGVSRQTMTALGWASASFDVVLCLFNTLGYLATDAQRRMAMAEFARVLKPGGWLLLDVMNRWHLGEGVRWRRTLPQAVWEVARSYLMPGVGVGNKYFVLHMNGKAIPGFVHGFAHGEMVRLLQGAGLDIVRFEVVGYDTGQTRPRLTQGQFFYIARKPHG